MKSWYPHTGCMGSWAKDSNFVSYCEDAVGIVMETFAILKAPVRGVPARCSWSVRLWTQKAHTDSKADTYCKKFADIYIYIFICKWEHEAMVVYILSKGIFLMPAKMGELRLWMLQPIQTILWTCGNRCSNHRFGSSILWEGSVGMRVTCSDV